MAEIQGSTSVNREKVVLKLTSHLRADGMPEDIISVYKTQGDSCYSAFAAGKMAAERMVMEGDISEAQIFEVAMEFAKIITMKITLAPQPSPVARPGFAGKVLDVNDLA